MKLVVENDDGNQPEPVSIELARTRSFLRQLKKHPFLAIIVTDDGFSVYRRGDMSDEDVNDVLALLVETIKDV